MKKRRRQVRRVHAIVPVNVLRKAKARLSRVLTPAEREQLTVVMLKDVLSALAKARHVHAITVVSADKGVRRLGKRPGASFLWEGKRPGLNKAIRLAIGKALSRGFSAVLIIHADLPLLNARDVDRFVEQSQGYSVAITKSKDGSGTNALLLAPPQAITPVFGKASFRRHVLAARRKHAPTKVLQFNGICFDVDRPRDLIALLHRPPRNETGRFLRTLGKCRQP